MADILAEHIIETLTVAPTMALVNGRIFAANLASVPDPVFPMVTFDRPNPGYHDVDAPFEEFDVIFQFHSETGHDEAFRIYQAAKVLLDKTIVTRDGTTAYLRQHTSPLRDVDRTGRPVYRIIVGFVGREIG